MGIKFKASVSDNGRHLLERRKYSSGKRVANFVFAYIAQCLCFACDASTSQSSFYFGWSVLKSLMPARSTRKLPLAEFLPCLEKHGKTCRVLLSPGDMHLVMAPDDAEGMRIIARFAAVSSLFKFFSAPIKLHTCKAYVH